MADLYQHAPIKFSDSGLQLRVPIDMVPAGQYSQLLNVIPLIEGRLETRGSLKWIVTINNATVPGSGCHSLTRLNQPSSSNIGDRIAGIDTTIQSLALPNGNAATLRDSARTGDPLSLLSFHFQNDTAAWQIITDWRGMFKYKGGPGAGYYQSLGGTIAPDSPATASDGGVGLLNSTGGPGYDWLYTYVNTTTLSETNPSPVNFALETRAPTADVSPEPGFGGAAFTTPAVNTGTGNAFSATETRQSILWKTFAAASGEYQSLFLSIAYTLTIFNGNLGGAGYAAIFFSLDGGVSWKLGIEFSGTGASAVAQPGRLNIPLSPTQDLTLLQVRAVVLAVGNVAVPQNVTVRRIRQRGGNFAITDLLTGGGGNLQINLTVTLIETVGVLLTTAVTALVLVNRSANVCIPAISDPSNQYDAIRLYRRGGSVTASWAFVGQFTKASLVVGGCGVGSLQINDNVADANLGGFISFTNDQPVTSIYAQARPLPYVWGPGLNPSRLFGCGDPDRPDAVYFSNPGDANTWGVGQWVDVSSPADPMQNGCVFNTQIFAFSKERMFSLTPSLLGGSTITPFQTPCSRGLISPWGLIATARVMFFVAKDGVYATTGGEETSLVEGDIKPIFPTLDQDGRQITFANGSGADSVDVERIEDIRLRFHNDELWLIYRGKVTGTLQTLIFDTMKKRWRAASYSIGVSTIYSEEAGPKSSLLLGASTGDIFTTQRGGADSGSAGAGSLPIVAQVQTGAYDQGMPLTHKEYGGVIFDIDPGGATPTNPITIIPLVNGEALPQQALVITGSGRQTFPLAFTAAGLPIDILGYNIEFYITWTVTAASPITPVLYQFGLIWRPEPTPLIHWEVRETSHGLPGYQHIRDMYVALRSSADVILTIRFDNNYTQLYTIPSTAGLRQKVYVPFQQNKFKTVRYSFDSALPFKLYIEDSETRVKPWLTALGYQIAKPFGAEATEVTAAFESKLLEGR